MTLLLTRVNADVRCRRLLIASAKHRGTPRVLTDPQWAKARAGLEVRVREGKMALDVDVKRVSRGERGLSGSAVMSNVEAANLATVRAYLQAIQGGAVGEALATFFTPDAH